jgi:predicted dehydrogenase
MLHWGILGTSFISDVVAKAIVASDGSQIQAVFGRDEARLAAFADRYGITSRYTSLDALLDDPAVDAIYVGLPSHKHAEAVIQACARSSSNKHVRAILSEKSLATTMQDSHAMMKAVGAAEPSIFFLEGLMYLTHPLMQSLADVLRSGALGEVRGVSGYYAANIASKANPLGRGTIYNLGCYPVSLLHFVMETAHGAGAWEKRTVLGHGKLATDNDVTHVRDAALTARFDCGVLATIQSSDSFGNDFSFTVQGDKASLTFLTNPWLPKAGDNVMQIKPYSGDKAETITVPSNFDAFGHQIKKVEDYVCSGAREASRPSPSWANSIEIMGLLTEWEQDILRRNDQK